MSADMNLFATYIVVAVTSARTAEVGRDREVGVAIPVFRDGVAEDGLAMETRPDTTWDKAREERQTSERRFKFPGVSYKESKSIGYALILYQDLDS